MSLGEKVSGTVVRLSCWRGRVVGTSTLVPVARPALLPGVRDLAMTCAKAALCGLFLCQGHRHVDSEGSGGSGSQ